MSSDRLYRLAGPSAVAIPPAVYSYSALTAVERCPRQWQLVHSRYGDRDGFPARPPVAAAEGEIVHRALDRVFRTLALRGLPAPGTGEFRAAVAEADVRGEVTRHAAEFDAQLARHPRGGGCRMTAAVEQLVNRVIRLFRETYSTAAAARPPYLARGPVRRAGGNLPAGEGLARMVVEWGAVSELSLVHPDLPFRGRIDLVWADPAGPVVADFKTGQAAPEHRAQVGYYAVLWWRRTGVPPARVEIRYPGAVVEESVTAARLAGWEVELAARIRAAATLLAEVPAAAVPGPACQGCDVRQFCQTYWATPAPLRPGRTDLELVVASGASETGFTGTTQDGQTIPVVFTADVGRAHGPFPPGEQVRILNAQAVAAGKALELRPWSEVFRPDG